jgi:hypothetical protein
MALCLGSFTNILLIAILLLIIILAVFANILNIEISWDEIHKLPKFQLHFEKDNQLLSLLAKFFSKEKEQDSDKSSQQATDDFQVVSMIATATISYGEQAETLSHKTLTLKALKEGVNQFSYYSFDSGIKIRCVKGFLKNNKNFRVLRKFSTWEGSPGNGALPNLHRASLSIPTMRRGQTNTIETQAKVRCHYLELLPEADTISHYFYYKMDFDTFSADLKYKIPNSQIAGIFKFILSNEKNGQIIFEQEIQANHDYHFNFDEDFGHGSVTVSDDYTTVNWRINRKLYKGNICKLQWYTKRYEDD